MIIRAYKYRLCPTQEQRRQIDASIGVCRLVYNLGLEVKTRAYKEHGVKMSSFDLCYQLVDLRKEYAWVNEIDSQALQAAVKKVEIAFKNFFRGNGFPKFKSKHKGVQSFQCPNNKRKVDWENSTLTVPKIENIPIILSRKFDGKIKTVTISRTPTGKYFASILVETNAEIIKPHVPKEAIGVDLGIKDFAAFSNGQKVSNPKYLSNEIIRLGILQRRASRKRKGSKNRKKANFKVAALHEKITNQRKDFLHKLSTRLISDNQTDTICVESLAVSNMVRNHKLAQAITDVSWAEFVRQLEYKGNWYGKNIIKINRFYASSKTCSDCGHKYDELNLSERTWQCSNCGSNHDRDINAAINIRNSGMGSPVALVESLAIAGAMKQESKANRRTGMFK